MQYLFTVLIGNFIAVLVGVLYFKKLSTAHILILLQVLLVSICEIIGYYESFNAHGNAWVFNSFYLMPELWLSGAAGMMLAKNSVIKKATPFLIAIGTLIWIAHIYNNGLNVFSNWTFLYVGIALTIIYFDLLISSSFSKKLLNQSDFWLSLSFIFYFCCAIPYFGMYHYLAEKSPSLLNNLFYINQVLNFIRYPIIALSFYLYARQQRPEQVKKVLAD